MIDITTMILATWLLVSVALSLLAVRGLKKLWAWDDRRRMRARKKVRVYKTRHGIKLER